MGHRRFAIQVLLALTLLLGSGARPALASNADSVTQDACAYASFYMYNAVPGEVYVDVANWTTATRVIFFMQPGQEVRFSLEPGAIEYWAAYYDEELYGGEWVNVPPCSHVAAYLKLVRGELVVTVYVFPGK